MNQIGFLLLSFLVVCSCNAQNKPTPEVTHIDHPKIPNTPTSKGHTVSSIIQDKTGDIWFGTTGNGIYRYAGNEFTNYTAKDGIGSNTIFAMLEDKDGFIWIGTDAGLCRYKPSDKTFTRMMLPVTRGGNFFNAGDAAAHTQVWSIMQDNSGKLWFGTYEDGVLCYDPSAENSDKSQSNATGSKTITRFLHDDGVINESNLRLNNVNCIVQDKSGAIWFATWFEGLCRYDPSTSHKQGSNTIVSFKPNDEVWFSSMLEDKDGVMWVGRRSNGFFRFDPTAPLTAGALAVTNVLQNGTLDSCSVGILLQDRHGVIWLGSIHNNLTMRETHGGLWRFDPSANGTARFKNITPKDGLPNNNVWSALKDDAGFIWFGTTNTGLYRYDPSAKPGTGSHAFVSFSE